jgi:hypothetical protein
MSAHALITVFTPIDGPARNVPLSSSVATFMKIVSLEELLETGILILFSVGYYYWILSRPSGAYKQLIIAVFGVTKCHIGLRHYRVFATILQVGQNRVQW